MYLNERHGALGLYHADHPVTCSMLITFDQDILLGTVFISNSTVIHVVYSLSWMGSDWDGMGPSVETGAGGTGGASCCIRG